MKSAKLTRAPGSLLQFAHPVSSGRRRPRFIGLAVLILLPVVLLAGFGLVSLRMDRTMAEQQARDAAQASADQLAQQFGRRLESELSIYRNSHSAMVARWEQVLDSQRRTAQQNLDSPEIRGTGGSLDTDLVPDPGAPVLLTAQGEIASPFKGIVGRAPEWMMGLSPKERQLWFSAQAALAAGALEPAAAHLDALLGEPLSADARANALYLETDRETQRVSADEAMAAWRQFSREHPLALGEAGLPLNQIALLRALRFAPDGSGFAPEDPQEIWGQCQTVATPLIPIMVGDLKRIATGASPVETVQIRALEWLIAERDRTDRGVTDFVKEHPPSTWGATVYWFESEGDAFLALMNPTTPVETNASVSEPLCELQIYPAGLVTRALSEAVDHATPSVPPYAAVLVELGERALTPGRPANTHNDSQATGEEQARAADTYNAQQDRDTPAAPLLAEADGAVAVFTNAVDRADASFKVRLLLADGPLLYAQQRRRGWVFGGLIVLAAAVAISGLLAAQHAFREQLRLNELKTTFLSSVSHELRAPIASVRLLVESLARGTIADEAKRRDYFALIGQECRRLSSLIENVLDFSRIDQGRKRYLFEPTDLLALVRETVRLMEPYAAERQVSLQLAWSDPASPTSEQPRSGNGGIDPAPPILEGVLDGKAIQQAVINLIDNAVKHTSADGTVTIGLAPCPPATSPTDPRTSLVLWVADQGPGIPRQDHDRIFEPFYRRGSELRRETPGVGIGLSIVKHIVIAHGGSVSVESEVGHGSRFVIKLPMNAASPATPFEESAPAVMEDR